jgi:hypothetical protein
MEVWSAAAVASEWARAARTGRDTEVRVVRGARSGDLGSNELVLVARGRGVVRHAGVWMSGARVSPAGLLRAAIGGRVSGDIAGERGGRTQDLGVVWSILALA